MKIFFPDIFWQLFEEDKLLINVIESFDILKNQEGLNKVSGADGGKGGEFFIFS